MYCCTVNGGRRSKTFLYQRRLKIAHQDYRELQWGPISLGGGALSFTGTPLPIPNCQVLLAAQVERSEASGPGASSQVESGAAIQELVGSHSGGRRPVKVHCR